MPTRPVVLAWLLLALPGAGPAAASGSARAQAVVDSLLDAERYGEAAAAARDALPDADPDAAVDLHSALMLAHFHSGDLAAARAEQEQVVALRAARRPPEDPQRADDLNDLAMICDRQGDDAAAADAWARSLALLRALPVADAAPRTVPRMSALAEAHRRLGRYEECEKLLREAIGVSAAHLPPDQRHARLLNNLGALEWDERRFDEASRDLREALRLTEADPAATPSRVAIALHNLANLKREQGEWAESEALHRRALSIAREHLAEDPRFPVFLKEVAVLYADLDRIDESFALWDEALRSLGEHRNGLLASEILYERGRAQLAHGKADLAEKSLRECLGIRRAKRAADHPMIGQALVGLGAAELRRGRRRDARRDLERARDLLASSAVYPDERVEALEMLARIAWDEGRREAAVASMRSALDAAETLRWHRSASERGRADWARRAEDPTRTMVTWLVRLGRVDEAIGFAERIRGRILGDQIAAAHVDWRRDLPPDVRADLEGRERDALARIGSLRRELEADYRRDEPGAADTGERLDAAVRAYRELLEEGHARSRGWARALDERPADTLVADARRTLSRGEVLLSYEIGPAASFVFEIAADGAARCAELRIPPDVAKEWNVRAGALGEADLAAAVAVAFGTDTAGGTRDLRGVGAARPAAPPAASAPSPVPSGARALALARLADVLVPSSLRQDLLAADRVLLIPDGPLHDVPFEALVLEDGGRPRYWLDDGPLICYGASIATILELSARPRSLPASPTVLTVYDPERGMRSGSPRSDAPQTLAEKAQAGRFHPLPGARREGDAFRAAFGSGTARVVSLAGADAREADMKRLAPDARILHLGVHGIVDRERSDLLAALVLADEPPGAAEDGFLHLFEVYELRLAADLVVLSACETMQGEPVRGEGVLALSRGFLAAGARRVVASLWPVHDDATAELMTRFFGELARGADAAEALRTAKRSLRARADREDPFFWAPFVLSGSL